LSGFGGWIFFLYLLVDALGFKRLVGGFEGGSEFDLRHGFPDSSGGLVNDLLVKIDGLLVAVGVAINGSQRELAKRTQVRIVVRSDLLQFPFRSGVVADLGGSQAQQIGREVGGVGVRILVHKLLKLFVSGGGAFLCAGETRRVGLRRHIGWPNRRIKCANRLTEIEARFLVLLIQVVPPAEGEADNDKNHDGGGNQLILVLNGPVHRPFSDVDGSLAKAVLFQLMAGFCAHEFPF